MTGDKEYVYGPAKFAANFFLTTILLFAPFISYALDWHKTSKTLWTFAPAHASETLESDALSGRLCVSPPAWALVSLFLALCTISPPWLLIYCPRRGNLSSSLCNQCVTTDLRSPMQNLSSIIAEIHPASSAICLPVCHSNQFSPAYWQYWAAAYSSR